MGKSYMTIRRFVFLLLIFLGIFLSFIFPLNVFCQSDLEPRTYFIWKKSVSGDYIRALRIIKDVNNDGNEDLIVASEVAGNGYLLLLDGKDGKILAQTILGYEPDKGVVYINGYVAVAKQGGIDVYNSDLKHMYTIPAFINTTISRINPAKLQTFDGSDLVFIDGGAVRSYLLSTGGKKWEISKSRYWGSSLLILSPHRAIYAYPYSTPQTNEWRVDLIDNNGKVLMTGTIFESGDLSAYSNTVYLAPYDQAHFLYSKSNGTSTVLRCHSIIGDNLTFLWEAQIDNYSWNKGFVIVDTNNDGKDEVVAVWGGNVTVYDGSNGRLLYVTNIERSHDISDIDIVEVSDIDGNRINEVAVLGNHIYLVSFQKFTYRIIWMEWYGWGLEAIQDVDGDHYKDIVVASFNDITCLWGGYDDDYPSISLISPHSDETFRSSSVTITWHGSDTSGIDHYMIRIDGGSWSNVGASTAYTFTSVSDGVHIVEVKAVDKVGRISNLSVSFTVNTSLIGGPGWTDDIIVFVAIVGTVFGFSVVIRLRKTKRKT